jgi:hypothetical protein
MMRLLAIDLGIRYFSHSKHTMYISYVAENDQTKRTGTTQVMLYYIQHQNGCLNI